MSSRKGLAVHIIISNKFYYGLQKTVSSGTFYCLGRFVHNQKITLRDQRLKMWGTSSWLELYNYDKKKQLYLWLLITITRYQYVQIVIISYAFRRQPTSSLRNSQLFVARSISASNFGSSLKFTSLLNIQRDSLFDGMLNTSNYSLV